VANRASNGTGPAYRTSGCSARRAMLLRRYVYIDFLIPCSCTCVPPSPGFLCRPDILSRLTLYVRLRVRPSVRLTNRPPVRAVRASGSAVSRCSSANWPRIRTGRRTRRHVHGPTEGPTQSARDSLVDRKQRPPALLFLSFCDIKRYYEKRLACAKTLTAQSATQKHKKKEQKQLEMCGTA